jgi:SAM-dependent methyltransferase
VDAGHYDPIADVYDTWTADYRPDVDFYVSATRNISGPVVELGVGTGRIAVPTALQGTRVIGVDASERMLEECRQRARDAGVIDRIDLRQGDFRRPPVSERVGLVTCPFRSFTHLNGDSDRREALAAVYDLLEPDGRFVFDVFTASPSGVEGSRGDWEERAPGIWQRDRWDAERRLMNISLRSATEVTDLWLAWLHRSEWRALLEDAGFEIFACYGWFDRSPCCRDGVVIWVARRPE